MFRGKINSFSAVFPRAALDHASYMLSDWTNPNHACQLQENRQYFRDWVDLTNIGGAEKTKG